MNAPDLRLTYKEYPWEVSPEVAHKVGSMETQRLTRPYKAAVPVSVADLDLFPLISRQAREAAADASAEIVEFETEMSALPAPMPAILLRTESASSSRIENLTAGARRIAAATLGVDNHENALLIAANVAAMRAALAHPDVTSPADVLTLHRALLEHSQPDIAGNFRTQQVWIWGSSLSPHGSTFVPPHHSLLPTFMTDLIAFIERRDIPPLDPQCAGPRAVRDPPPVRRRQWQSRACSDPLDADPRHPPQIVHRSCLRRSTHRPTGLFQRADYLP